jgi:hypothetical protein
MGKPSGWEAGKGLAHRLGKWKRNSRRPSSRLDSELAGLRQTNTLLQGNEIDTKASFGASPSTGAF